VCGVSNTIRASRFIIVRVTWGNARVARIRGRSVCLPIVNLVQGKRGKGAIRKSNKARRLGAQWLRTQSTEMDDAGRVNARTMNPLPASVTHQVSFWGPPAMPAL
jgi:hypothetical protein